MTPREPIDQLIDEAAARLTRGNPSDALRATVMARISVTKPSLFATWRLVFAGGAVAAVVVVSLIAFRTSDEGAVAPTHAAPTVVDNAPVAKAEPTTLPTPSSPLTPVVNTPRVERASHRVAATQDTASVEDAAMAAWRARATPALDDLDALVVKPIEVKTIDITPLGVAPMVVLALPDGSNR